MKVKYDGTSKRQRVNNTYYEKGAVHEVDDKMGKDLLKFEGFVECKGDACNKPPKKEEKPEPKKEEKKEEKKVEAKPKK